MPRLKSTTTGVVVNVDDATAKALGAGWEPVDKGKSEPKRATRKGSAKATGKD